MHWAVTQFTPAAMDVVPVNSAERMCAIYYAYIAPTIGPIGPIGPVLEASYPRP